MRSWKRLHARTRWFSFMLVIKSKIVALKESFALWLASLTNQPRRSISGDSNQKSWRSHQRRLELPCVPPRSPHEVTPFILPSYFQEAVVGGFSLTPPLDIVVKDPLLISSNNSCPERHLKLTGMQRYMMRCLRFSAGI